MPAPVTVIVNAAAGGGIEGKRRVAAALKRAGIEPEIDWIMDPKTTTARAREAAARGAPCVVAMGGDGTVNAVIAGIHGSGAALGVIPAGTLNHFAKDLGIPLDLEGAAAVLAVGRVESVDLGEVNGRLFVNNSSLGLYPAMVRRREKQRRDGWPKWIAMARAAFTVLRHYSLLRVRLEAGGEARIRRAPIVFIGNNEYVMSGFNMGARARLDGGLLSVHVPHDLGPWELLAIPLKALFGRLRHVRNFDVFQAAEILVETRRKRLAVALDGEVDYMRPPLRYRALPGALRLIAPAR